MAARWKSRPDSEARTRRDWIREVSDDFRRVMLKRNVTQSSIFGEAYRGFLDVRTILSKLRPSVLGQVAEFWGRSRRAGASDTLHAIGADEVIAAARMELGWPVVVYDGSNWRLALPHGYLAGEEPRWDAAQSLQPCRADEYGHVASRLRDLSKSALHESRLQYHAAVWQLAFLEGLVWPRLRTARGLQNLVQLDQVDGDGKTWQCRSLGPPSIRRRRHAECVVVALSAAQPGGGLTQVGFLFVIFALPPLKF
jgi:hypothetical protein